MKTRMNKGRLRVLISIFELNYLQKLDATGSMLTKELKMWAGSVYVHLMYLESRKIITSRFVEGPYPRRRIYTLTSKGEDIVEAYELLEFHNVKVP